LGTGSTTVLHLVKPLLLPFDWVVPSFPLLLTINATSVYGRQIAAFHDHHADCDRFVIGRAMSAAAQTGSFDILPRRQGL
jgi:hypothetical protein